MINLGPVLQDAVVCPEALVPDTLNESGQEDVARVLITHDCLVLESAVLCIVRDNLDVKRPALVGSTQSVLYLAVSWEVGKSNCAPYLGCGGQGSNGVAELCGVIEHN